jgi:hypothetical protein
MCIAHRGSELNGHLEQAADVMNDIESGRDSADGSRDGLAFLGEQVE